MQQKSFTNATAKTTTKLLRTEPTRYTASITHWAECADLFGLRKSLPGACKRTFLTDQDHQARLKQIGLPAYKPTIRSSGIALFETCKRRYFYRYRCGLRPRGYTSALNIGQFYHIIMSELYAGSDLGPALGKAAIHATEIQEALTESTSDAGLLPSGAPLTDTITQMIADLQLAKVMVTWVWANYPVDFDQWEVLFSPEMLINLSYTTLATPIRVRVDALLKNRSNNEVWIVDHKTTGMISTTNRARMVLMEVQPRLYRLAVDGLLASHNQKHGTKLKCVGMIHNLIRKPRLEFSPGGKDAIVFEYPKTIQDKIADGKGLTIKQCETREKYDRLIASDAEHGSPWHKYLDRVTAWYDTERLSNPDNPPYLRSKMRWSEPAMYSELLLQLRQADAASRAIPNLAKFYRSASGNACFNYNKRCPYWDLCTTRLSAWPAIIKRDFDIVSRDEEDENEKNA